ncbi:transcriptional regulator [Sphaerisporangium siamense]|uniref:Putative DNA-binding transcriptional regulator YafY n=1 Tax=Sphaerisporangium siamense TaxID=795645 RepID=A0A7W7DB69_9ACTN|nr:YafY family protein [Sphaerisporangium siamense]MBB4702168.1 putative DNA-binding transcriptional regulator YafY [Sphaerisporangium siamense]GII87139.1 transcriptional regulator [Sphaerisporangium siamense]
MNRTDRLYALVEELRAISPRCRSARELSERLHVSVRTIERDIAALQQAGVPIYAEPGRRGGYVLDKAMSLPPLNFTPAEAVAIAVALSQARDRPFAADARSALRKLVAAMPGPDGDRARELASRVHLISDAGQDPGPDTAHGRAAAAQVIDQALQHRRVLLISYEDRSGALTRREVEPGVFVGGRGGFWYLVGFCRLRQDVRVFRLDRIHDAELTGETASARPQLDDFASDVPNFTARNPVLD